MRSDDFQHFLLSSGQVNFDNLLFQSFASPYLWAIFYHGRRQHHDEGKRQKHFLILCLPPTGYARIYRFREFQNAWVIQLSTYQSLL